jgi:hydrogenase 3 maturation protease
MNQVIHHLITGIGGGSNIAFLGVGSPLRADDSVGLYIVGELKSRLTAHSGQELRFYLGESAPENFSGEIRNFGTTHLIIVDAADMDEAPGVMKIIEKDRIGGTSFSTHMMPLKMLTDYLVMTTGCQVFVVGIQPKCLAFGQLISEPVKETADQFLERFVAEWQKAT